MRGGGIAELAEPLRLGALYEENARGLLAFARGLLADGALAEDAVHQAFATLVAAPPGAVANPRSYLYGAVRNAALNVSRGERRRAEAWRRARDAGGFAIFTEPASEPDEARAISAAVAELDEPEREAVIMKVWGGLTFDEIGAATGTSPNTVASRYRAALGRLREKLEKRGWP